MQRHCEAAMRSIENLDIPLRQVFIEVLVVETDVKKSMEFGLQWAAGGQIQNKVGFGTGNFAPKQFILQTRCKESMRQTLQRVLDQIPLASWI